MITSLGTIVLMAAASSLSVSVEQMTQAVAPRGASRVALLTVHVALPCSADGAVTLQSLHVKREGLGDAADIEGLYVLEGSIRQSRVQTIDRKSQDAVLRLRAASLLPCEARTLTVAGSFASTAAAGAEHRVSLRQITMMHADGTVVTTDIDAAVLPPARIAPVDSAPPVFTLRPLSRRISYGAGRTLARFLLSAQEDDLLMHAITLENRGSASGNDLQNLRIVNAKGEILTTTQVSLDGDRVRLEFRPPLLLERSSERLLELRGDVRSSIKKTVRLELTETDDMEWTKAGR